MSERPQNIVFVGSGDPKYDSFLDIRTGGSGPIWRLARSFAARGHNVTLIGGSERGRNTVQKEGVKIMYFTVMNIPGYLKRIISRINMVGTEEISQSPGKALERLFGRLLFSYRICEQIERADPDGLFLRSRFSGYFPSKIDVPTVFTVKSPDACDFFYQRTVSRHPANRLLFHYKQCLEESMIKRTDRTIVMNEVMYDYFQSKGFSNIDIVTLGVEDDEIVNDSTNLRKDQILYVGRFDGNKRPDWLLDAYISAGNIDYELHFIGSGPRGNYLRQKVEDHNIGDNVVFHGRISREDVLSKMREAKIFVLPSEFEICSNVTLEAMASGCPVIASNSAGPSYLISHGENGLLFDKDNKGDLANKLRYLCSSDDLQETLRSNALEYIRENHRAETIANKYWDILKEAQKARDSERDI